MKNFIQPKRLLIVAGLALAVPLSAMAFQGQGGKMGNCDGKSGMQKSSMHGGHGMKGGSMSTMRGLHRLDLSEAQQDKIFDIMHAQAPAMRDQMKVLRKAETELKTLKTAPDYSEAKAKTLIDSIASQRAAMDLSRLQAERKVMDVLTPEQRKQLAEMKPGQRGERGPRS